MAEMFCREHGMHHDTELSDTTCEFEDGLGETIADIPGFEGTRESLASLRVSPNIDPDRSGR